MNTRNLTHGIPARLFPVVTEACKEQKTLSIILATMISVRPFAERVLAPLSIKLGKRSSVNCFTEVTLENEVKGLKDRPDALIVVDSGKKSWSALIEAKVGKNVVEPDQLSRYIELAKLNNVDALITISNELTPAPDINPTQLPRALPKSVQLFHLSWASLLTTAFLLATSKEDPYDNDDEAFLISELIRYLEHANSGLLPLAQMNKDWPKIISDVQAGHPLSSKSKEVTEMITTWLQEARDVALIMTRRLKESVSIVTSRSNLNNPSAWGDADAKSFVNEKLLRFELDVPNAVSKICVEADFLRRAIRVSMKLGAPTDKASNSARLNWLLRQLSKGDKEKIIVRCITRGKGQNFGAMATEIEPKSDEIKALSEIVSFQVEMSVDLGARFNSRKKFIESLEEIVPEFYQNVGQHLQPFVPSPPKLKEKSEDIMQAHQNEEIGAEESDSVHSQESNKENRPHWAAHWQTPPVSSDGA
ncbi:MAG: hypothetical protein GXP04_10745 [Alphaproteobacteria bacterium]|nr:hypothetical protein [Alphaproteobacteria bacterium]